MILHHEHPNAQNIEAVLVDGKPVCAESCDVEEGWAIVFVEGPDGKLECDPDFFLPVRKMIRGKVEIKRK
jgi:hypothetical protein